MIGYQFLIELDGRDDNDTPVTVRFCCSPGYTGGGHEWLPYIVDPGLYHVSLFSGGRITGPSSFAAGDVVLDNSISSDAAGPGPLDHLRTYKFYGGEARAWFGPVAGQFPDDFTRAYTAVAEAPQFNRGQISLALRSRQVELDEPLDTGKFLGNNVPPAGLNGGEELKDAIKPAALGRNYNCTAVCCNTALLIYAISPLTGISVGELGSNLLVADNGNEITVEAISNDLEAAAAPTPAKCIVDPAGYIRLGARPIGVLTVSFAPAGYALTSTPANLVTQALTLSGKSDMLGSISMTDNHERGIWLAQATPVSQILDRVLAPLGYFYYGHDGLMHVGQLADPATMEPVYTFDGSNIQDYSFRPTQDTPGGIPPKRITLQYAINNTVMAQPAAIVNADRKEWLAKAYRELGRDTGVTHPLATEMILPTVMTHAAPDILDELEVLHSDGWQLLDIDVTIAEFLPASRVLPGQCVLVSLVDRYDYVYRKAIVVEQLVNYRDQTVKTTVWG